MAATITTAGSGTAAAVTSVTAATAVFLAALTAITSQVAVVGDLKEMGFPQQYESFNFFLVDQQGNVVSSYYAVIDWDNEKWADRGEGHLADADIEFVIDTETLLGANEAAENGPGSLIMFALANSEKIQIHPTIAGWTIKQWAVWNALTGNLAGKASGWS